jgi:hypothetical protein
VCIDTFVNGDDDTRIPWQEEDDYFKKKKKPMTVNIIIIIVSSSSAKTDFTALFDETVDVLRFKYLTPYRHDRVAMTTT